MNDAANNLSAFDADHAAFLANEASILAAELALAADMDALARALPWDEQDDPRDVE